MSTNPKIIVVKTREIIYTILLFFFVILLIVCLVLMFSQKKEPSGNTSLYTAEQNVNSRANATNSDQISGYTAGVYTTPVTLGESAVDVEVTVDRDHINSIRLVNLSEATAAAFPLVSPSLEHIASQILETQTLENITCPQENRYTSQLLLSAIAEALEQARAAD